MIATQQPKIKVDVIGLLPVQERALERKLGRHNFRLRFIASKSNKLICSDHVILMTKFISHKIVDRIRSANIHYANGAIESVLAALTEIEHEQSPSQRT